MALPDDAAPDAHGPISLADVQAAARRLRGVALRTPLLPFGTWPPDPPDVRAWLKPESLQAIGAFKIRGAYNALCQLTAEQRAAGVVTHSSGNHAQGVARAARLLGIRAVIVMPSDAPAIKVAGVRADGASIDSVGPNDEERVVRARELAARDGLVLVPSYDDERIVAGQGTIGLEIVAQLREAEADHPKEADGPAEADRSAEPHPPPAAEAPSERPLTVLVPIGGGGLSAGICIAVKGLRPEATVIGVEPELAADAAASMEAGRIVSWSPRDTGRTIADGVRTSALGGIPFRYLHRLLDAVVTVSEDDIALAMLVAARQARLVVEPSGALPIAAWLARRERIAANGDVVMVVSGGNVDPERYLDLLAGAAARRRSPDFV